MTDVEVGLILASGQGAFVLNQRELEYDVAPSYSGLGGTIDFTSRPESEKAMLATPLISFPEQTFTTATYPFRNIAGPGSYNLILKVARTGDRDQLTLSATKTAGADVASWVEVFLVTSTGESYSVLSGILAPDSSASLINTFYPGASSESIHHGSVFDRLELWDHGNGLMSHVYITNLAIPEEPLRDQVIIYGGAGA